MDNFQLSDLAQKAKNGDMAAFEKLYIEFSPEIYAIACEITRNKEESHDLVQDCFVAALENISTLKEPDKIKNWLIRIAANKSRDYLKKKKPSVLTEDQYEVIDNLEEEDIAAIPEVSLETEERIDDVNEILACLTEEKRLCLLLRFKYDMSYAEIANELGITESAVKSRISRAKDDIEKEADKRKKKGLPLFGVVPFGLVIFALKRSADITAATFAGSTAQTAAFAGVTAASQAGIAAASTAATATTAVSGTVSAGTTATAATGIGAKVAAMSVAQKVVAGITAATIATGSATVTTVVVKNKIEANQTTTAYVEEVTTAPYYGFESETVFIPAVAETVNSTAEFSTSNKSTSTVKQSTTVTKTKATDKSTVANKATTKSTAKANTTTQKQTTTKATTTKKETTTEEVTTAKPTAATTKAATTKAVTTTKAATTTTTKATTTTTTTESASPATVTVTLHTSGSDETTQKILSFDVGESITDSVIEQRLMSDYGIDAMSDSITETAESGKSYAVDAFIIS